MYETPSCGLCILHAQVEVNPTEEPDACTGIKLPPFSEIERRLHGPADEEEYGAYSLSLINRDARKASGSKRRKS